MVSFLRINLATEKLMPFQRDFSHFPHIAVAETNRANIHYIGFEHPFAVLAAKKFAHKLNCVIMEITQDELVKRDSALPEVKCSGIQTSTDS